MQSRLLLANTCLADCRLVVFRTVLQAVVALSTGNDLGKSQYDEIPGDLDERAYL